MVLRTVLFIVMCYNGKNKYFDWLFQVMQLNNK